MAIPIPAGVALRILLSLTAAAAWASGTAPAHGQFNATVSTASETPTLSMNTAVAGAQPSSASTSSSYGVNISDLLNKFRITVQLDSLSTNLTLSLSMSAPSGARSQGTVPLTTTPKVLVCDIGTGNFTGLGLNYTLQSTGTPVGGGTRIHTAGTVYHTLTFTVEQHPEGYVCP